LKNSIFGLFVPLLRKGILFSALSVADVSAAAAAVTERQRLVRTNYYHDWTPNLI